MIPETNRSEIKRQPRSLIEWVCYIAVAIAAIACFAKAFLNSPVSGQEPAPTVVSMFRDTVYVGDDDRNFNIIWTRGDYKDPASFGFFEGGQNVWQPVELVDNLGVVRLPERITFIDQSWYTNCFWRSFRVPSSFPLGIYTVRLNGKNCGKLTVAARTKPFRTLTGRLLGLNCEPNMTYYAYNATIMGPVKLAAGSSLCGATVIDSLVDGNATDTVIKDCKFIRCTVGGFADWVNPGFGYLDHGALWQNCLFDQTICTGCCSGCFYSCTWTGKVRGVGGKQDPEYDRIAHNFVNERSKRLCFINAIFDKTDRGPILRTAWADNSDGLIAGLHVLNVDGRVNSGETLCVEGNQHRFDRWCIFDATVANSPNWFGIWNTPATGNLIGHSTFKDGCTVNFSGLEPQDWNECRFCTLCQSVKVNAYGKTLATNTKIGDVTMLSP